MKKTKPFSGNILREEGWGYHQVLAKENNEFSCSFELPLSGI
jgi:hypothetical protein